MGQQFLASLTLQNGLVMHGVFSAIQAADLPPSGVVAGGYTSPSLILDQFGRVLSAANATSPPIALTNFPNVFTIGPQRINTGADSNAGLAIVCNSTGQTALPLTVQVPTFGSCFAVQPQTASGTGSSAPGAITGPLEGTKQTSLDMSAGNSTGGQMAFWFWNGGFNSTLNGYFFSGIYNIFGTGDCFFQAASAATGWVVFEGVSATSGAGFPNIATAFGANDLTPLIFYTGRNNYASATSAEVLRITTAGNLIQRANDASNIVQNLVTLGRSFADATDATFRGQFDLGVWDAGGGTPALRPALRVVSDGSEAIITITGPVFQNTPGRARVTAPVTNATVVLANLSDLTLTLIAGRKYTGRMVIFGKDSIAAEGLQFDFNGGSATMTSVTFGITAQGATIGTAVSTALGTAVTLTSTGIATDIQILIEFGCVVNAGGTIIPRFAQNTHAAGTGTVETNSYLWLEDSPN